MKDYIKLQYDNLDFDDDVPDDLVRRREVYAMLNHIGGAGAEEDYFKGWDSAIDEACDLLSDVDSVMPVTADVYILMLQIRALLSPEVFDQFVLAKLRRQEMRITQEKNMENLP